MAKILLVEDNERLAALLLRGLRAAGHAVDLAPDAAQAAALARDGAPDAVVLDLGLPDGDGLGLLRRLRAGGLAAPVLVATARGALGDRVLGLDTGADDYLVKPFATEELLARLRALLRRPGGTRDTVLAHGNVGLDTVSRGASVAGAALPLPPRETALLELLLRRAGRTVAREAIEAALYPTGEAVGPNALEAAVSRLRRQLDAAGADVAVHTVRGVGYFLERRPA